MRVRITSGQLGGRFIKTLPTLRPMMEMARKAMFDILGSRINDARFLDLFAGSGAVGIEAISRGATQATFIEKDPSHYRLIKDNLRDLGIADIATVRITDANLFVASTPHPFEIVFAAPWYKDVADLDISQWDTLLTEDGILILEHLKSDPAPKHPSLTIIDQRTYGDTALTFYQPK